MYSYPIRSKRGAFTKMTKKHGFSVYEKAHVQIEHSFKIIICRNNNQASEGREIYMRKLTLMLTTVFAGFVAVMTIAADHAALADDGRQSVSMLLISPPYFLILIVGAGVIGSIAFLFIVGAEVIRRRRRKYSCIQH